MTPLFYRIRRDDNEQPPFWVGLDDDFPCLPGMASLNHQTILNNVLTIAAGALEHPTEFDLVETAVPHARQDVGTELEFPKSTSPASSLSATLLRAASMNGAKAPHGAVGS